MIISESKVFSIVGELIRRFPLSWACSVEFGYSKDTHHYFVVFRVQTTTDVGQVGVRQDYSASELVKFNDMEIDTLIRTMQRELEEKLDSLAKNVGEQKDTPERVDNTPVDAEKLHRKEQALRIALKEANKTNKQLFEKYEAAKLREKP